MNEINEFDQIRKSLTELNAIDSSDKKIENLIQIILDKNELNKIIYESYFESINLNKKIFDALSESFLIITKRLNDLENWSNDQNELNQNLTNTIIDDSNSIRQINENIEILIKLTDNFSEHLGLIENRLDLLS